MKKNLIITLAGSTLNFKGTGTLATLNIAGQGSLPLARTKTKSLRDLNNNKAITIQGNIRFFSSSGTVYNSSSIPPASGAVNGNSLVVVEDNLTINSKKK